MLNAIADTSISSLHLIEEIRKMMVDYKHRMRKDLPKIYSQDLLNNLFRHPHTKIDFVENDLGVSRQTAAKYLNALDNAGFVKKQSAGRQNYYINPPLVQLFLETSK